MKRNYIFLGLFCCLNIFGMKREREQELTVVSKKIKSGKNSELLNDMRKSYWFEAICQGDVKAVKNMLQLGFDPNEVDFHGFSALWYASELENDKAFKLLLGCKTIDLEKQYIVNFFNIGSRHKFFYKSKVKHTALSWLVLKLFYGQEYPNIISTDKVSCWLSRLLKHRSLKSSNINYYFDVVGPSRRDPGGTPFTWALEKSILTHKLVKLFLKNGAVFTIFDWNKVKDKKIRRLLGKVLIEEARLGECEPKSREIYLEKIENKKLKEIMVVRYQVKQEEQQLLINQKVIN